jgi:hypothetical protein
VRRINRDDNPHPRPSKYGTTRPPSLEDMCISLGQTMGSEAVQVSREILGHGCPVQRKLFHRVLLTENEM